MKPWILAGLFTSVLVSLPASPAVPSGKTRTYYIQAERVDWNYAPNGNLLSGVMPGGDKDADVWLKRGLAGHAPVFHKAVYREYTDATFTKQKQRGAEWVHLGILGPVIRAEVGDHIVVVFHNKTFYNVSLHPHGVFYDKASEGSAYPDDTGGANAAGNVVAPFKTYTYHWEVPERAGPGPNDPSSVVWLYHSHVDSMRDIYAGLIGVIIVTRRGAARPDGSPADVDREFVTLFMIDDETLSSYAIENRLLFPRGTLAALGDNDAKMTMPMKPGESMFAGTPEANQFFSINGYIFGNLPLLQMKVGDRVRWYLVTLGSETDVHTPHWHGNVVTYQGHRTDVIELLPASMKVADMVPDDPGIWLFHCHVEDHMMAGMMARYQVVQ